MTDFPICGWRGCNREARGALALCVPGLRGGGRIRVPLGELRCTAHFGAERDDDGRPWLTQERRAEVTRLAPPGAQLLFGSATLVLEPVDG